MVVSLMCLIVVLGMIALLTIYRSSTMHLWTMRSKSYPLGNFGRRGTVESVLTVALESISTSEVTAVCEMIAWAGSSPLRKIAAIVRGKWPERTRSCSGWFYSELFVVVCYCTKRQPPYSYIPYNSLD
jgi:hypothetical protein